MDFNDATALMRLVQAVENDPYVSSGSGEALADKVREFIEDEAELGGWYTELMDAIGEGEIADPLADFTVGQFRVHLVQEGERYGASGGFVYGKALSNGSFGIPINDCQLYGHGLPLVEFYDVSQAPAKFPEGQFVTRYYMSTLLGMGSFGHSIGGHSIGEMSVFELVGGVPICTISGDDLKELHTRLCAARDCIEQETSHDEVNREERSFKECGTFTDHGFGFHAQAGTRTDYIIGYPYENDGWAVLTGSYDLENDDLDCHVPEDYLNGLISYYGYSSLDDLKYVNGDAWRNVLTGIIAERQEANRFEVPRLFSDHSSAVQFCTSRGIPADHLIPAMEKARAEYEKVKAAEAPEKAVSLKGEAQASRAASEKLAEGRVTGSPAREDPSIV